METTDGDDEAVTAAAVGAAVGGRVVKPDAEGYKAEMDALTQEIANVQLKVNAVRERIGAATGKGSSPETERRKELRARLEEIRRKQGASKGEKQSKLDQLRALNDSIKKKTTEMQASKGKLQYRSSAEVDAQIRQLEAQVESGKMKLIDEKRALTEINTLKKSKKVFESFVGLQAGIDQDRQQSEALRASLDDPESKALSAEHDKIKGELDELHKASNEAFASRQTIFDERDALSKQLDGLYTKKKDTQKAYREANDKWYNQSREDREKRDARRREEMEKEDDERRQQYFAAQLEEASTPAFGEEIHICENLITYFEGGKTKSAGSPSLAKTSTANVPKLEVRQVEAAPADLQLMGRKYGKDEDEVLFGGKKKKTGKASSSTAPNAAQGTQAASGPLRLDLVVMDQLRTMDVAIPLRQEEVPATLENLRQKVEWFKMNNEVVTAQILAGVQAQQAQALENLEKERSQPAETPAKSTGGRGAASLTGKQSGERRERKNFLPKGADASSISSRVKKAALSTLAPANGHAVNGLDH